MVPPKWIEFDTGVAYRRFEAKQVVGAVHKVGSGYSDMQRVGEVIAGTEAFLLRHCREFEPQWLDLLEELHPTRIIPVRLMPPRLGDGGDEGWVSIRRWLCDRKKRSVVYVALGSEVTPRQEQLSELAHGLELSGVPFFWVVRKASECESVKLPEGFEERVSGRGMVWRGWVPQLKILSDESVGGFLTHCGWSSIVEGMMFGRPLMTLPFLVDQGLNSRVVVGRQLRVEIPRNEEDGSFTREAVAETVKAVMISGKKLREKAEEVSAVVSDTELHNGYIDDVVAFLQNYRPFEKYQLLY